jgi:hypothetical protein
MQLYYVLLWKKWAIHNPLLHTNATTLHPLAFSMKQCGSDVPRRWICVFIGSKIESNKAIITSIGALATPTVVTTLQSIIPLLIIVSCDHNTCMSQQQQIEEKDAEANQNTL